MQEAQGRLRARWANEDRWPQAVVSMQTRIGVHTGTAIVGNIGSELRFNYTMMGDTVNLAQRIEAAGSHYGTGILVSGETVKAAMLTDPAIVSRHVDRVLVPGRNQPVELHELLGRGGEARERHRELVELYEEARDLYCSGLWAEAGRGFARALVKEHFPTAKNPSSVMLARCERMHSHTPVENFAFPLAKDGNSI